jgi:N-methylhydantoinase A
MVFSVGVDIGGTFTDAAAISDSGSVFVGKTDTTPQDISEGVVNALGEVADQIEISLRELLEQTVFFSHGTTVGSNALLTKKGAKVGLIVTKGFEDTPFIQRSVGRLAGLSEMQIKNQVILRQPEFFVPKKLVRGITERIDCFGRVVVPLDREEAKEAVKRLIEEGVEAIAICLLWSFANNTHEQDIKALIEEFQTDMMVTASSDLIPKIRENARMNSTVINCFVGGSVNRYLARLKTRLAANGLSARLNVMQVFGGLVHIDSVEPILTINSGPVGGVIGAKYLAAKMNLPNLITADVGGTSFDVSIIHDGEVQMAREYFGATGVLDRYEVLIPRVDIKCIGAGGGSIARFDPISRTIKLGPESAGADPGPIFYDIGGTEPTLADAWLALGLLNPKNFLGGRKEVNTEKTLTTIEAKLARPMGMTVQESAAAVVELANNSMADTIRERLAEKGYDHRDFFVLAFGGAGLLHATSYGRLLGIKKIILAQNASVFSALGIALSDIIHKYGRSVIMAEPFKKNILSEVMEDIKEKLGSQLKSYGDFLGSEEYDFSVEMKFRGQIHELSIPISEEDLAHEDIGQMLRTQFSRRYEEVYGKGSGYEKGGAEIVAINGTATGKVTRPSFLASGAEAESFELSTKTYRNVFLEDRLQKLPIYDSAVLGPGATIAGPAIVEYPHTTGLLLSGQTARVDELLNVHVFEEDETNG